MERSEKREKERLEGELERKLEWYTDRLESLYERQAGKPGDRRNWLKRRIETFYRELREERQQHCRDEQERREVLRELAEIDDGLSSDLL